MAIYNVTINKKTKKNKSSCYTNQCSFFNKNVNVLFRGGESFLLLYNIFINYLKICLVLYPCYMNCAKSFFS